MSADLGKDILSFCLNKQIEKYACMVVELFDGEQKRSEVMKVDLFTLTISLSHILPGITFLVSGFLQLIENVCYNLQFSEKQYLLSDHHTKLTSAKFKRSLELFPYLFRSSSVSFLPCFGSTEAVSPSLNEEAK